VLKIAVVAPMPRASVAIAARGNAGALRRLRSAKRRSWSRVATRMPPVGYFAAFLTAVPFITYAPLAKSMVAAAFSSAPGVNVTTASTGMPL